MSLKLKLFDFKKIKNTSFDGLKPKPILIGKRSSGMLWCMADLVDYSESQQKNNMHTK